eukprot:NODE_12726_length_500_cov_36.379310_g12434_i0.p1 GENE.NODE_12726_length_500_cov_36.379310_g12434_i0~~NODE_12726_length_500_cov_36.379310_g12434_i0.p1  ORF type:complete len:132 (-),score=43.51 NODE_12726_length_500_cov_36.379310_g12434_i0:104-457(-)
MSARFALFVVVFALACLCVNARQAEASHILVKDESKAKELLEQVKGGANFGDLARQHSTCPSGKSSGGSLGKFGPGQMVPEFDKVVFSAPVGEVQGPVKTQFGYHLIMVESRTGDEL